MEAISSASSRLPRRNGVMLPAAIRWANASARALLPTPGSPNRQGLFFWRRHKISIIRSSSASRQSTGSNRPSCARRVRSRPYFSLGLPPREAAIRGWAGSTIWPESWRHSRAAWGTSMPRAASQTLAVQEVSSSMAQSRCSFPARAVLAAWAPSTANSMALRLSAASGRRCQKGAGCPPRTGTQPRRAVSVTRLRRRKSAAGPRAVRSIASSRCPVSASAQPCRPASRTAARRVQAAAPENPL